MYILRRRWIAVFAGVAELADALDLGSSVARRVGSSPSARTSLRPHAYDVEDCRVEARQGVDGQIVFRRYYDLAS